MKVGFVGWVLVVLACEARRLRGKTREKALTDIARTYVVSHRMIGRLSSMSLVSK
jgi:hypothetical protein